MNFNLWFAKSITKRIEKYEHYVEKVNEWIKRDKKERKIALKKLTKEENLKYGRDMGFISNADYEVMKPLDTTIVPYAKPKLKYR